MTAHTATLTAHVPVAVEAVATGGKGLLVEVACPVSAEMRVDLIPRPVSPPIQPVLWQRISETYPDPVADRFDRPDPVVFAASGVVREPLGYPFIRVAGADLTYLGGVPAVLDEWSDSEPLGWETAVVTWPQRTLLTADTAPQVRPGAPVDIGLADPDHSFSRWLWRGFVAEAVRDESSLTMTCVGLLRQGSYACHQPPIFPTLTDSGWAIADALTRVVSRRYGAVTRVTTGIQTARRGARADNVTGFVEGLLSLMTTDDGRQWTVMPNGTVPLIRMKDRTTVHWTVTAGSRGVAIELTDDLLEDPNVIYGSGIDPNRERWDNSRWPGSTTNLAPPYPNASPSNTITQGETDANTGNGQGVTQLQTRLNVLGFRCPISGSFGSSTRSAVRAFQRSVSILVDGIVGGQTWNALWPVKGALGTPFFLPIAADPKVMPNKYAADGTVTGANPAYDPSIMRIERFYAFGDGVSRTQATVWSENLLARNAATPNVVGRVRLTSDPREGSRKLIGAGQNIRVRGYAGSGPGILLHIGSVTHTERTSTLSVDARARDALELDAIVARDRDAVDPARRILAQRQSEPPAGVVPRTALWSGLWSVMAVPMGPYGQVVRTALQTASPKARFAVAMFSRSVTSNWLASVLGDPLSSDASGWGKMTAALDALEAAGYLIGWGQQGQAMGMEPGETSPTGGPGTLTGRFQEDATWEYACQDGAYLHLAVYADRSTYLSGRLHVILPYGDIG